MVQRRDLCEGHLVMFCFAFNKIQGCADIVLCFTWEVTTSLGHKQSWSI